MMLDQFCTQCISDSGCKKCKYHFRDSATQEKGEATAGKCRSKTQGGRRIQGMNFFNLIQALMNLLAGHVSFLIRKTVYKLFHSVQF